MSFLHTQIYSGISYKKTHSKVFLKIHNNYNLYDRFNAALNYDFESVIFILSRTKFDLKYILLFTKKIFFTYYVCTNSNETDPIFLIMLRQKSIEI